MGAAAAIAAAALACVPAWAWAKQGTPWYESVTLNGFFSAAYGYNFNHPGTRMNDYRVFDVDAHSFTLDVAELVIERAPSANRPAGFRVDLTAGSSIPHVTAARGLFHSPNGQAQDVDLQQAFVTYVVPLGSGLRVDAGKFVTPLGYEVIEGYDNYNDNVTRSFLFGYAIPFTHTGVKGGYAFCPHVTGTLLVTNGWDNATDNNDAKTLAAQVGFTPGHDLSVSVAAISGAEQDDNTRNLRQVVDVVATWTPPGRVTLGANYDAGREDRDIDRAPDDVPWHGGAAYVRVRACERFALRARGEWFSDPTGARTGFGQTLKEITLTPEYTLRPGIVLRGDLRHDWSDMRSFSRHAGRSRHQTTTRANVIAVF